MTGAGTGGRAAPGGGSSQQVLSAAHAHVPPPPPQLKILKHSVKRGAALSWHTRRRTGQNRGRGPGGGARVACVPLFDFFPGAGAGAEVQVGGGGETGGGQVVDDAGGGLLIEEVGVQRERGKCNQMQREENARGIPSMAEYIFFAGASHCACGIFLSLIGRSGTLSSLDPPLLQEGEVACATATLAHTAPAGVCAESSAASSSVMILARLSAWSASFVRPAALCASAACLSAAMAARSCSR